MNCTECGAPALLFDFTEHKNVRLVRCRTCAFYWLADDTLAGMRKHFDANTLRPFAATVRELKLRAKGASDAALLGLVEELGRAEDVIFDEAERKPVLFGLTADELAKQVADLNVLLADSCDPVPIEEQTATAAMLSATLAKRKGAA